MSANAILSNEGITRRAPPPLRCVPHHLPHGATACCLTMLIENIVTDSLHDDSNPRLDEERIAPKRRLALLLLLGTAAGSMWGFGVLRRDEDERGEESLSYYTL